MFTNRFSKIFAALLVLVIAFVTVSFIARPTHTLVADRSYDSIEELRAANVQANHSYDAIEQVRMNHSAVSTLSSYNQIESMRVQREVASLVAAFGYDAVEQLRIRRAPIANHSYDQIETIRLER